jgi:hypothetical protein
MYTPYYYRSPDSLPTPLNIPDRMRQNETNSWNDDEYEDVNGNVYSASVYTLTYVLAGASLAPVSPTTAPSLTGTAGWTTSLTPAQAALLLPGAYWWQGILTAPANPPTIPTNFRLVAGEGQLTVEVDLGALTGPYDGRTTAQKALAACEMALSTFNSSNGLIKRYNIAGRMMEFQDTNQIISLINYWRSRVAAEISTQYGGADRKLLARWSRAH